MYKDGKDYELCYIQFSGAQMATLPGAHPGQVAGMAAAGLGQPGLAGLGAQFPGLTAPQVAFHFI